MLNVHLVIIDPQNDFMGEDDGSPYTIKLSDGTQWSASLPVRGAVSDMKRLSTLIDRIGHRVEDIHVTLDSHHVLDEGHPPMWRDQDGRHPGPFTIISVDDFENGVWSPTIQRYRNELRAYVHALAAQGNYPLMVWPEHCVIGTVGHSVQSDLRAALMRWERKELANVDWVVKGTNPLTEHFGALMAEVPDPRDPSTQLNVEFLKILRDADIIGLAGEASSHCVLETLNQIDKNIGDEHLKKIHLLTDCMSPVGYNPGGPDFPKIATDFLKKMESRGMVLTDSHDFLA